VIGKVVFDGDDYGYVRVIVGGQGETWSVTRHDIRRMRERAAKREAPDALAARPSWRLRLAVWLYNWTRP
jgi:hypothetical protein